ncbi:MAG: hypothetical protein LBH24_06350 [Clostridiales bacterium]|nr:hypothetical protein [Clostridiales bacterium]
MKGKLIAVLAVIVLGAPLFSACGKIERYDKNTLIVNVYNGGYGVAWAEKAAAEFNKTQDTYTILIGDEKLGVQTIEQSVESGLNLTRNEYAYFTSQADFSASIRKGLFEDLSDIADREVDGAGTGTVRSKIRNYDEWAAVASIDGAGLYMLPYADSFMGFVFDYGLFTQNGWLTRAANDAAVKAALTAQGIAYAEAGGFLTFSAYGGSRRCNYGQGDVILEPGKDGLYGTYDDGQPKTLSEWDTLIKTINAASAGNGSGTYKPFIYSGKYAYTYLTPALHSVFAQIVGAENYRLFYTYDSGGKAVTLRDGSKAAITPETGHLVYQLPGVTEALDFIYTYLNNNPNRAVNFLHPAAAVNTDFSHTDAQDKYLMATVYGASGDNPQAAMLFEGSWWENEAKNTFDAIEGDGYSDYRYGNKDFRYMLYPNHTGQATPEDKTVFAGYDTGAVVVPATSHSDPAENAARKAVVKDFIAYTCKRESMTEFTVSTGNLRPYEYTVSEDDFAKMTRFARNVYTMYNDRAHIEIVRPNILTTVSPFYYATDRADRLWQYSLNGKLYNKDTEVLSSVYDNGKTDNAVARTISAKMIENYTAKWDGFFAQYAAFTAR